MQKPNLNLIRRVPIAEVLQDLGYQPDPADPTRNWRGPAGRVTVTGEKFFLHDTGRGGGGAIDAVMLSRGVSFRDAVAWLAARVAGEPDFSFRSSGVLSGGSGGAVTKRPAPSRVLSPLPGVVPRHLPRARAYLIDVRRIPASVVDSMITTGAIFADARANACFRYRAGGVELRGTGAGAFHGFRGAKDFAFRAGDVCAVDVMVVESAIEALSASTLFPGRLILATGGNNSGLCGRIVAWAQRSGRHVFAGQNADRGGDRQAAALMGLGDGIVRERPPGGLDWNDVLCGKSAP
ncbi:MAG: DUF3991 and TOPRIM domain-containing protein [Acidiferrobacterales bacterium]